jgi:hypothetical protein
MIARPFLLVTIFIVGCSSGTSTSTTGGGNSGGNGGVGASDCLSFSPVDIFVNMNGTVAGSAVTAANLSAATEIPANFKGWIVASASQSFQGSQVAMPAGISINGGSTHGCSYATQSLSHKATGNFTVSKMELPTKTQAVIGGWIANLPPNQEGLGSYFDLAQVVTTLGFAATIQVQSGTNEPACTAYGIEIESSGGTTHHSACIGSISPGGTYFVQMHTNFSSVGSCAGPVAAPCAEMNVYSTSGTTFTQIGSTVSVAMAKTDTIAEFHLGNDEGGQFPGEIYFQNWMVDYTKLQFPNLPH